MTRKLSFLAAAVLAASPVLAEDTYVSDKAHSEATFTARHLVSKLSGRFNDFESTVRLDPARPEASSVVFTIKAASIDTRHDKRDQDLRDADFFDVQKHPEITFKSTRVEAVGKDQYRVTGDFTLRGVTRQIAVPVTFLGFAKDPWGNEKAGFEIGTTLNRKDYGIVWNKTLDNGGVLLGDDVTIAINLEMTKQKAAASQ